MVSPLDKQPPKKEASDAPTLLPGKPVMDMSLESNRHPKEVKNSPPTEPLTPAKQLQIETSTKEIQKTCKNIVDHICRCRYHPEDIIIGEASIDTQNFVKPDSIILQQQGSALINTLEKLTEGVTNLAPDKTPFPMEFKYKRAIVEALKEDIGKTKAPFEKVKTTLFGDSVSMETTVELLDDTVNLMRNAHNVMVQIDKLKAADTINWQLEEAKAERKRQEEVERKAHEEEVRPLRAEKQVIDQFDGIITGFSQLPDKLHKTEQLTDPSLQELPKYIRHTKDGCEPDPLFRDGDEIMLCHPALTAGLGVVMIGRAIARKANTVKELNPERPTKEKIDAGLRELSSQIQTLKQQTEFLQNYPTTRNPNANWTTIQQIDTLRKALPQVKPILDELEDLPNKQETWNLATIRACMLRAKNSAELQQVIQTCIELDNERKNLQNQINPPTPKQPRYYDPYGNPYLYRGSQSPY